MSKLDEIYIRCDISNNRTDDPLSLDGFKQEIKALVLGLIGENIDIQGRAHLYPSMDNGVMQQWYDKGTNDTKDLLRKKVGEL